MPLFELVYFETNRLSREVDAPTIEEAIVKANHIVEAAALAGHSGWDDCEEESLGTNGVEEAYVDGKLVYKADGDKDL